VDGQGGEHWVGWLAGEWWKYSSFTSASLSFSLGLIDGFAVLFEESWV
jgi:hypothetical protein